MKICNKDRLANQEFLIWFAGFFDGEGCIPRPYCTMSIGQKGERGRRVLERIKTRYGGTVRISHHDLWQWRLSDQRNAAELLRSLLPYLQVKKDEAIEAIARVDSSHNNMPWTIEDEDFLSENYGRLSLPSIASHLRRTEPAIKKRLTELRLSVARRIWLADAARAFRNDGLSGPKIAKILGISDAQVYRLLKADNLRLRS